MQSNVQLSPTSWWGQKKYNKSWGSAGILGKFLSKEDVQKSGDVSPVYTKSTMTALQLQSKNPEHFVLKPQREGGGNNFCTRYSKN